MRSTKIIFSIILTISYFEAVQCDWKLNGTVSLKSSLDNNLCARTETYNDEKVFLKLVDCNLKYADAYTGSKQFDLGIVDDNSLHRQIRTRIFSKKSNSPEDGCFYASYVEDSIVLTDRCDPNNPWHHWEFKKLSATRVQWIHKQTGKCVTVPTVTNGTTLKTANCDVNDRKQIWDAEFLEYDWHWEDDRRKVTFKLAADDSLCMTTDQFDWDSSIINLWPCSKVYEEPYAGKKEFDLGKVKADSFEIRTVHLPKGSAYGVFACFYTGFVNDSPNKANIFTKRCNYNDGLQYFKFIETSANRIQLYHNFNEKCIRATDDRKTVVTANCDKNDVNQIWLPVFRTT